MMLAFYGVTTTEEELATRLKTNEDIGTLHRDLIRVAREEGFYVFENDTSSIVELGGLLKLRFPVIVHFADSGVDDNHYAVVVKIDDTHLILNDPYNGERVTIEIDDFISRWSSERATHEKWVMAISHEPFSLGRQYAPKRNRSKNDITL